MASIAMAPLGGPPMASASIAMAPPMQAKAMAFAVPFTAAAPCAPPMEMQAPRGLPAPAPQARKLHKLDKTKPVLNERARRSPAPSAASSENIAVMADIECETISEVSDDAIICVPTIPAVLKVSEAERREAAAANAEAARQQADHAFWAAIKATIKEQDREAPAVRPVDRFAWFAPAQVRQSRHQPDPELLALAQPLAAPAPTRLSAMEVERLTAQFKTELDADLRRLSGEKPRATEGQKPKLSIDELFADLENAFNGMSSFLIYFESPAASCCRAACLLPVLLVVYALCASFGVLFILPTCFVILILRVAKVETRVEAFAVRQEVLAAEPLCKKIQRLALLVLRALPMQGLLLAWPLVACLVVLPRNPNSAKLAMGAVGGQLAVVLVLQVLGAFRAVKSFEASKVEFARRKREKQKEKQALDRARAGEDQQLLETALLKLKRQEVFKRAPASPAPAAVTVSHQRVCCCYRQVRSVAEAKPRKPVFPHPSVRWTSLANVLTVLGLLLETVQLATLAISSLAPDSSPEASSLSSGLTTSLLLNATGAGDWVSQVLIPAVWGSWTDLFAGYVLEIYTISGAAVTGGLLLLFLRQLLAELRRFGLLKREGNSKAANETMFFSFVGAVIYGHGEVRGVSTAVRALAALLADTLFMVVCSKLLLVLSCDYSGPEPVLLIDSSVVCWRGRHSYCAAAALVSLSYYAPFCAMASPMLSQSNQSSENEDESDEDRLHHRLLEGRIAFIKPFLTVVTVAKLGILLASTFFGGDDQLVTCIVSMLGFGALAVISAQWATYRSDDFHDRDGFGEPAFPPQVNVWRTLAFWLGCLGGLASLLGAAFPRALGGDRRLLLVLVAVLPLSLCGWMWFSSWQKAAVSKDWARLQLYLHLVEPDCYDLKCTQAIKWPTPKVKVFRPANQRWYVQSPWPLLPHGDPQRAAAWWPSRADRWSASMRLPHGPSRAREDTLRLRAEEWMYKESNLSPPPEFSAAMALPFKA